MKKKNKSKSCKDCISGKVPFGSKPLEEFPALKYFVKAPKQKLPAKRGRLG